MNSEPWIFAALRFFSTAYPAVNELDHVTGLDVLFSTAYPAVNNSVIPSGMGSAFSTAYPR